MNDELPKQPLTELQKLEKKKLEAEINKIEAENAKIEQEKETIRIANDAKENTDAKAAEKAKLGLEKTKADEEKKKIEKGINAQSGEDNKSKLTLGLEFLKWIGSLIVIGVGIWTTGQNIKANTNLQVAEARDAFILQAAELILTTGAPSGAQRRAQALAGLFPEYINQEFADELLQHIQPPNDPHAADKEELLTLLINHPDQRVEIVEMWRRLYPDDEDWTNDLLAYVNELEGE